MDYDNKKRFTIFKKYRFDKYVFRTCFLFLAIIVLGVLYSVNGDYKNDNFYYTCGDMPCANPFYCEPQDFICENSKKDATIPEGFPVEERQFPPGFEWGERPPWIVRNFTIIVFIVLLFGFLINHYAHNKRFDFKEFHKELNDGGENGKVK